MAYTDPESVPRSALLAGGAAVALILAAFLPWSIEAAGTFGGLHDAVRDGYLTFGVAVGVVAVAVVLEWNRVARALAATGGFVAVYVFSHWHGRLTGAEAADVGLGLWLSLVGGLGLLAAAAWGQFEAVPDGESRHGVRVVSDSDTSSIADDRGAPEDADASDDGGGAPDGGDGTPDDDGGLSDDAEADGDSPTA